MRTLIYCPKCGFMPASTFIKVSETKEIYTIDDFGDETLVQMDGRDILIHSCGTEIQNDSEIRCFIIDNVCEIVEDDLSTIKKDHILAIDTDVIRIVVFEYKKFSDVIVSKNVIMNGNDVVIKVKDGVLRTSDFSLPREIENLTHECSDPVSIEIEKRRLM